MNNSFYSTTLNQVHVMQLTLHCYISEVISVTNSEKLVLFTQNTTMYIMMTISCSVCDIMQKHLWCNTR